MKSIKLTGIRQMACFDAPEPQIARPTDVVIRLGAVGVCGSDIHYYTTGRIGSQVVEFPFAVGHECAGTVVEVGNDATLVKPGDRVAIEPAITCGDCDQCRSGRDNTCRNTLFLGCPGQVEGALSEYLVMPQQNCFKIDDSLDMGVATIFEPLAIGVYAVQQSIPMLGARIGILGLGPIGRAVLLPAIAAGCAAVYATDKIDARCEAAGRNGAAWVGNPSREDIVGNVLERESLGLDAVFECCGQQDALDLAVDLLKPGGKLMLIGIAEVDRVSFNPDQIRRKELTLVNVRRQRGCVPAALSLIDERRAEVDAIITHRIPFAETQAAFDLVADYRDGVIKAMIEFD